MQSNTDRILQPITRAKETVDVLFVEDNFAEARRVQEILYGVTEHNYTITHVTRLSHAFERLENQAFDVILTDLGLPDSFGLDTLSKFLSKVEGTPIIVLTGAQDEDAGAKAISKGAQDYLTKDSISCLTLRRAIHYAIERHRADNALAVSEQQNSLLVENAPIGIFIISNTGQIISANPALTKLLGLDSSEDLVGAHLETFLCADEAKRLVSEVLHLGNSIENKQTILWCRGEIKKNILISMVPLLNKDGRVLAGQGTVTDITELKMTQEARDNLAQQLGLANKLESVGQLAAGIAHEINTPSQFVGDNIHYIKDAFTDFDEIFELYEQLIKQLETLELSDAVSHHLEKLTAYRAKVDLEFLREDIPSAIDQALDGISRISTIVKAMKEFSHPGGDKEEMVDLNHAIESTITVARNEWKYVAEMVTEFDADLPMVECMPGEINQTVLNMVVNAAHAIEARQKQENDTSKGTITVKTSAEEGYVVIQISDTGSGISQENLQKVFDPFFTTKEVGKGSGQGLSIAHTVIVDKHDGKLDVDSELGRGTRFTIRLPIVSKAAQVEDDLKQAS